MISESIEGLDSSPLRRKETGWLPLQQLYKARILLELTAWLQDNFSRHQAFFNCRNDSAIPGKTPTASLLCSLWSGRWLGDNSHDKEVLRKSDALGEPRAFPGGQLPRTGGALFSMLNLTHK